MFLALIRSHQLVENDGVSLCRTRAALSAVFRVKFWSWNSPRPCWNYPDWERRISDGSVISQSSLHLNVPFIPKQPKDTFQTAPFP